MWAHFLDSVLSQRGANSGSYPIPPACSPQVLVPPKFSCGTGPGQTGGSPRLRWVTLGHQGIETLTSSLQGSASCSFLPHSGHLPRTSWSSGHLGSWQRGLPMYLGPDVSWASTPNSGHQSLFRLGCEPMAPLAPSLRMPGASSVCLTPAPSKPCPRNCGLHLGAFAALAPLS